MSAAQLEIHLSSLVGVHPSSSLGGFLRVNSTPSGDSKRRGVRRSRWRLGPAMPPLLTDKKTK